MFIQTKDEIAAEYLDLPSEAVIFGSTSGMQEVRSRLELAIHNDYPVLIEGEGGSGKEVVGKWLHILSRRQDAPFLKLNCGSAAVGSLETELLGEEETDADGRRTCRAGLVERASAGTLFLDELGEMNWSLQTKLVRILREGRYRRAGGGEDICTKARIVCASKCNLDAATENGTFRLDLLYRLGFIRVHLLPLRERKQDIPQICEYLLGKLARRFGRAVPQIGAPGIRILQKWDWPGNLRELENWIARIVVFGTEEVLDREFDKQLARAESVPGWHRRVARVSTEADARTRRRRRV